MRLHCLECGGEGALTGVLLHVLPHRTRILPHDAGLIRQDQARDVHSAWYRRDASGGGRRGGRVVSHRVEPLGDGFDDARVFGCQRLAPNPITFQVHGFGVRLEVLDRRRFLLHEHRRDLRDGGADRIATHVVGTSALGVDVRLNDAHRRLPLRLGPRRGGLIVVRHLVPHRVEEVRRVVASTARLGFGVVQAERAVSVSLPSAHAVTAHHRRSGDRSHRFGSLLHGRLLRLVGDSERLALTLRPFVQEHRILRHVGGS